ncbi:retrotransposon protein, putative, ty1-copia subclass [Tanacetum coccineum]|uniref:Retrotransposon protein, putative, ty1-copia subclass n=1 Tax=Tanacetum coccineum TaxID=301880 RepID=A0ABQ5G536_9ASTR
MEMWSGHPSDYGMLRIFGCVAYPYDKQGKLEPRAFEVELQRLNNYTPEEDQTDQEDGVDEDVGDQETNQPPDLTDYQLVRDREPRTRMKPLSSKWKTAMKEEMDSLKKKKTWELVDHPVGQKLVSCKWLFKIKEGIEGVQKPRYKARLVACGFTQRAVIDYNEVFSLHFYMKILKKYMRQPPGYEQGNKVCLLKKSLYGLKQSPRQWYKRFDEYMMSNQFSVAVTTTTYITGVMHQAEIGSTKSLLKKEFDMKELGEAKKIIGMEIVRESESQDSEGVTIRLSLKDCPVRDCDVERTSKVPYANVVGVTPPKSHNAAEYHYGVLLHSPYAQVTENDLKRDV